MCWFLHCGPGPCLKHHHKSSNQIQWTESQNMAIQKLILYKTFHGQELKFYIESPKVSENLINFDCNKWKVMIQSSIILELVPARSQWYICTKKMHGNWWRYFVDPFMYFYVWPWPFGVGALPAGEGVGGEATVDQGDVRLVLRVLQIQEVLPQLTRIQLALKSDNRVISLYLDWN